MPGVGPLKHHTSHDLDEPTLFSLVKDYVMDSGAWDWKKINLHLSSFITNIIAGVQPPLQVTGADSIAWVLSNDGDFSLKSLLSHCW